MAVSFVGNITYINQNTQASPKIAQEANLSEFDLEEKAK